MDIKPDKQDQKLVIKKNLQNLPGKQNNISYLEWNRLNSIKHWESINNNEIDYKFVASSVMGNFLIWDANTQSGNFFYEEKLKRKS